jgi:hypothetical protein
MPFVQSWDDLHAWRDFVATQYANEPDTQAMLQLFATELDKGTWDLRVTQAILMRRYGFSRATASRRWNKALETGLIYDTKVVFEYTYGDRSAEGHILRLFKRPGRH